MEHYNGYGAVAANGFDADDLFIRTFWTIDIGGFRLWITETVVIMWIIMAFLLAFAIFVRIKLRNFAEIPRGFQNMIEFIAEMFNGMLKSSMGDKLSYMGGWFFTVFFFILFANLSGILGVRPPTADWAMTFALALATFLLIQIIGFKHLKGRFIKKTYLGPHWAFLPLNLIGELARPISLSFRLYGNILAGFILLTLYHAMLPVFVRIGLPVFLNAYFDLVSGALQTYIFCILSMTFVGLATVED